MSDAVALSQSLARAVEAAAPFVVRISSEDHGVTGLAWDDDLVLAATDAIEDGEDSFTITDGGGNQTPAEVVGRDTGIGIAVLRAKGSRSRRPVTTPAAELNVGHLVLAVARPAKSARATLGIITTLGDGWRTPGGARIDRYIDTSLVLPWEFGGGVIVDAAGKVIGLGVPGARRERGAIVPLATLERVVAAAVAGKSGQRGYLGVATHSVRLPKDLGQQRGLLVSEVEEGGPAHRAGIALGDVILRFGGAPTEHVADLFGALADVEAGSSTTAQIWRGGKTQDVPVTVGSRARP